MIRVSKSNQNETSKTTGRSGSQEAMTPQQIQTEAMLVIEKGLSSIAWRALDLLYAGGILTVDQLDLNLRTLRRYAAKRIVDRYPFSPNVVIDRLGEYGLAAENGQLYTLGPVGAEIARIRHGIKPPSGYLAYTLERVLHDVIVNEIVQRIAKQASAQGWETIWASKYESSLFREDTPILEPDAYIRLERGEEEYPFLIEYHNEDKRTRAIQKVRQYERAWESDLWQGTWEVDEFPPLLAVFKNKIVGEGYLDGIKESSPVGCTYYGRALEGIWEEDGLVSWFNINKEKKGKVFPWLLD
jgi:hypothetical protein